MPSASFSVRREAIAPTIVPSSPSRIQTVPRPRTMSQCQPLQGRRSMRAGMRVLTVSGMRGGLSRWPGGQTRAARKIGWGEAPVLDDLIRTRRTHKAFGPDPVPRDVLLELFEL